MNAASLEQKKTERVHKMLAIAIVLIIVGVVVYFVFFNKPSSSPPSSPSSSLTFAQSGGSSSNGSDSDAGGASNDPVSGGGGQPASASTATVKCSSTWGEFLSCDTGDVVVAFAKALNPGDIGAYGGSGVYSSATDLTACIACDKPPNGLTLQSGGGVKQNSSDWGRMNICPQKNQVITGMCQSGEHKNCGGHNNTIECTTVDGSWASSGSELSYTEWGHNALQWDGDKASGKSDGIQVLKYPGPPKPSADLLIREHAGGGAVAECNKGTLLQGVCESGSEDHDCKEHSSEVFGANGAVYGHAFAFCQPTSSS